MPQFIRNANGRPEGKPAATASQGETHHGTACAGRRRITHEAHLYGMQVYGLRQVILIALFARRTAPNGRSTVAPNRTPGSTRICFAARTLHYAS